MKTQPEKGNAGAGRSSKGKIAQLEADLEALDRRLVRGDVRQKDYARRHAQLVEELGRAKIQPLLESGERVLAEHYVVAGHFKLTQSVLKEVAQEAVGLFATERRLLRWTFQDKPSPRAEPLPEFEERVEYRWYTDIGRLDQRREMRRSEALAGLVIVVLALVLWPLLEITGPLLVLTGLAGIVHALLMPTRWVAVVGGRAQDEVWRVDAPCKSSGRHLLAVVTGYIQSNKAPGDKVARSSLA